MTSEHAALKAQDQFDALSQFCPAGCPGRPEDVGCKRVYEEKVTGQAVSPATGSDARPASAGDVAVVSRLDRLAAN